MEVLKDQADFLVNKGLDRVDEAEYGLDRDGGRRGCLILTKKTCPGCPSSQSFSELPVPAGLPSGRQKVAHNNPLLRRVF